jgi:nucleotide-binding universal stress UspA family protein
MARACGAEVFLLSVVPETAGTLIAEGVHAGVVAHQIETYKDLLKRAVERLKQLGFKPVARLVRGEPTPAIAAVAKEISADLVVVGHREEGLLARWWSGSTQSYLTDHVRCSLLVARNPMSDEEFEAEIRKAEAAG